MTILNVACYCRVSTDSKDQANSFENQHSYFRNIFDNSKDNKLINIFADQGLTGTKLNNRPQFNKMLVDAGIDIIESYTGKDKRLKKKHVLYEVSEREPLFNEIWIKNTSRFARNTLSFEIINHLRNKGVHIKFIEQNINTADIGGDFLLKLFQVFDEQESRDKSSKVTFGIAEGARKGVISASSRLYGYKYIQAENRLEIIPHEAEVIKTIFNLYENNMGIRRVINHLTESNILTRGNKPFTKSTISNIITNEKYAGINARLKYSTGDLFNKFSYAHVKPKEEWIVSESDKIPNIIDVELFNKCQQILSDKVNHISQVGIYKGISEYAGLIYCGKCGNTYVSNVDRGRRFYNCKTKKQHGVSKCDCGNVSLIQLDQLISNFNYKSYLYKRKVANIALMEGIIEILEKRLDQNAEDEITSLTSVLLTLKTKQGNLLELHLESHISKELFIDKKTVLDIQVDEIERKVTALSKPNNEIILDITSIEETINQLKNIDLDKDYIKEEILQEVEKIVVGEKGIKVIYKADSKIKALIQKHNITEFFDDLSEVETKWLHTL